ncbi:hypothetical protein OTU49_016447 [Cherax quadricarinatus]|uniref:Uncharacterized protein n=1 Tax=Cherax quadricarinatus TaxID=27406 RepID=A0AAW0Y725_CHEQU
MGKYHYNHTPMGHCFASYAYTKRFNDLNEGIANKHMCTDNSLFYDVSFPKSFWYIGSFLGTCSKNGEVLHLEKFKFCQQEVKFLRFHLEWEGYQPTGNRLAAIRDFPILS